MNKQIFLDISDRLEVKVPELRWIDWDSGELDLITERPQLAFPACMIDIVYPKCEDETNRDQLVTANVILRVAFQPQGATSNNSPVREAAMAAFDVLDKIHDALQGWHNEGSFSTLSRASASRERRRDGIKVYRMQYQTTFIDAIDE
jgi:hypothetical protein